MFGNLGMGELVIIAGIALVVIGPEKFPEFAKIALRAYRDLRGYVDDIKHEMAEEMKPVKQEMRQLSKFNAEDYIDNMTKVVSALDEPEETKKEDETPASPPGDWSGSDPQDTKPASTESPYEEAAKQEEASSPSSAGTAD